MPRSPAVVANLAAGYGNFMGFVVFSYLPKDQIPDVAQLFVILHYMGGETAVN
jgi:hypothetical protein